MLLKIDNLRVLFLGNRNQDSMYIQQILLDGLHCPVFFDFTALYTEYVQAVARGKYDIILTDNLADDLQTPIIIERAISSGIPIIFLLDAPGLDCALALIGQGASLVSPHAPEQLIAEVYRALGNPKVPGDAKLVKNPAVNEMQMILDNLTDGFYVVDRNWRFVYINHMAETCWHTKREDLLGRVCWECFSPREQAQGRELQEIAMRERIPMQWELSTADQLLSSDISACPTQDGGLAVFFHDVTERKRAEEVLRISRERQAILLRLSDSLRFLDNPSDIQEAAARIIGSYLGVTTAFYCDVVTVDGTEYFSLERIYSDGGPDIPLGLHPIDSPGVLADENFEGRTIVVSNMATDPRISEELRTLFRKQGLCAWVSVPFLRNGKFAASFTVHNTTPRNWTPEEISLMEETTERIWAEVERVRAEAALRDSQKQALELVSELEQADRHKNEFINSLSHEMRNPLAAIVASLSMLDLLDHSEEISRPREIIKRQTDQMCHMVDDLLDLTRITNNKVQLNLQYFDLNELAQSSACDHRTLFEEKGIDFEAVFSAVPLYISADPVRISQIIGNLLNNACKFTEKGGKAILTTRRQEDKAVIVVKDTGMGIDAAFLPDLFKTFSQADHHKGGLGLGLSIVKGMIELHGGGVRAESDGANKGATFTVTLPLCLKTDAAQPIEAPAEASASKPLRVLVVDDNRDLAEVTCSLLKRYGYDVTTAYSGLEGIEKAKALRPHAVICDIGLPDITGYEVARRITDSKLGNIFLISLSGYAYASDFEYSRDAGFHLHISKPVDYPGLKKILDSIPS